MEQQRIIKSMGAIEAVDTVKWANTHNKGQTHKFEYHIDVASFTQEEIDEMFADRVKVKHRSTKTRVIGKTPDGKTVSKPLYTMAELFIMFPDNIVKVSGPDLRNSKTPIEQKITQAAVSKINDGSLNQADLDRILEAARAKGYKV